MSGVRRRGRGTSSSNRRPAGHAGEPLARSTACPCSTGRRFLGRPAVVDRAARADRNASGRKQRRALIRVLFTTFAAKSHAHIHIPLAWALRSAGHDVCVASRPDLTECISHTGLTAVGMGEPLGLPCAPRTPVRERRAVASRRLMACPGRRGPPPRLRRVRGRGPRTGCRFRGADRTVTAAQHTP
ncbi:hypothetical protein AAH978_07940 [Streptomyces sp. ZYX-F-203]